MQAVLGRGRGHDAWTRVVLVVLLALTGCLAGCGSATTNSASESPVTSASASPSTAAGVEPPGSPTASASVTAAPAATGSGAADAPQAVERASRGTALSAVGSLAVKGRAPLTGYDRAQFGQAWYDTDHNGCDTRNDILRRDLTHLVVKTGTHGCKVLQGDDAPDPYTGALIHFVYGGASEIDIDHVVALGDAWQTGAAQWSAGRRLLFANDPLNLLAVSASANRQKGDGDAATWLPSNKAYRCAYVARQVAVKKRYGLWVTAAERDAMVRVLGACPDQPLPAAGSVPPASDAPLPEPAAPPPTRATTPAPSASSAPDAGVVHPGSFCAPIGATGRTSKGTPMLCGYTANSPDRARWHRA